MMNMPRMPVLETTENKESQEMQVDDEVQGSQGFSTEAEPPIPETFAIYDNGGDEDEDEDEDEEASPAEPQPREHVYVVGSVHEQADAVEPQRHDPAVLANYQGVFDRWYSTYHSFVPHATVTRYLDFNPRPLPLSLTLAPLLSPRRSPHAGSWPRPAAARTDPTMPMQMPPPMALVASLFVLPHCPNPMVPRALLPPSPSPPPPPPPDEGGDGDACRCGCGGAPH
ncbi:hypothetical protein IWX49DRAFT_95712 [Phyllosticta citricarpa]|uniref:Uncharacterized protein n=2 Tax=Phyllosticta TaxID=121621 RepID=A0ABR1MNK9_9PEZI